jgi:endonuclease/exonuclease/phosphatase family metal-dependent hydrolase
VELTLVSYNIHSGIGTDGRFDLPRIGAVLQELGPDVVALQEVGDFRGVTAHGEHPETLAEMLGLHMAFGPNVERDGRRYGNAVLSKLPIQRSRNYDLSVRRREPRGALRCDLELGGGAVLHLFCLHLGLGVTERKAQEALLLSADILRDAVRAHPVVVCGDFNYWWPGSIPALVRGAIHDAALVVGKRNATFPARRPFLRLDRVYVDAGVKVLSVRAHRTPLATAASDHLPLVVRVETPLPVALPAHPVQIVA